MPAQSKKQQKFMGIVRAIQKGEAPASKFSKKARKVAKDMKKKDVEDFASTKHKGLPKKVKRESRVKSLIRKMVREIMKEDFAGSYPKSVRKKFDNMRRKQSEVLGYKLTGKDDIKTEIGDATVHEGKLDEKCWKGYEKKGMKTMFGKRYPNCVKKKRKSEGRRTGTETSQAAPPKSSKEKKAVKIYGAYIEYQLDSSNSEYMHKDQRNKLALKMLKDKFKIPSKLKGKLKNKKYHDKYTDYRSMVWEGKLNEAKETIFDVAARVMKDKQAHGYKTKKGLVTVDMQTANLLMQVFKKVNPKMKKILSDLGYKSPTQLMNTLWAAAR